MAKKKTVAKKAPTKKTPAKKAPPKKPAAKAKPAPKKSPAKSKPASSQNPSTLTTGRGPTPRDIGTSLVELFNAGRAQEVEAKWWSPDIVSIEGMGMAWSGRKAAEAKNNDWLAQHELKGGSAEGPYVGATGFAVKFHIEVLVKASGQTITMDEVGVYTVQNGKIIREEFMYGG